MKTFKKIALVAASSTLLSAPALADYQHYAPTRHYEVTLTNTTKGVIFTPFLAVTHNKRANIFTLGESASEGLGRVAEGGDTSLLQTELLDTGLALDTETTGAPLLPGESVTLEVEAKRGFNRLSVVSMLLPTNDTFTALRGAKLPRHGRTSYFLSAYDAGTENNDELCMNIPGPQCAGEPFSPEDEGEGYVYPAPGIHGEGDLSREAYDYAGSVVKVDIQRIY